MTSLPLAAGVGLRSQHHHDVLEHAPQLKALVAWWEVHSENFFGNGGAALATLTAVREHFPISLHGVGLSLGGTDALDELHLRKLKALATRIEPAAISEHLCWSSYQGRWLNELLPLPYTQAALDHVVARVTQVQDVLGRRLLVENLSSYVQFAGADMPEWVFLAELARRSGCGLLLDVNNIHVSASNHGFSATEYLNAIPPQAVAEIHLAGYTEGAEGLLIDSHSRAVQPPVWALFEAALACMGARPTLIEWDNDIPDLAVLLQEAHAAQQRLNATQTTWQHERAA